MVEGYFTTNRKINKQKLLDFIKSPENRDVSIDKILGHFSLQTGLKITTLKTYLMELKMAGVIDE